MNKENNKGFTLIELIVSVAILAIITAPFLNAFVIAAKNNAEANVKQNVTSHAESIMERFKAESFETLSGKYDFIDLGAIDAYKGKNYYYYDNTNKEYVFNLNGEEVTGRSNSKYTAMVHMKPQMYNAPDMTDINGENTAIVISEFYRHDNEAINNIYSQLSGIADGNKFDMYRSSQDASVISTKVSENVKRWSYVYITYDAALGTRPFEVSVSMVYELRYGTGGTLNKEYLDVFKNSYETLPDVLLFYTMYDKGTVLTNNDKIVVDNQIPENIISASGKKCRVYISNQTVALQNGKRLIYRNDDTSNIYFKKGGTNNLLTDVGNNRLENSNTEAYMSNEIYDSTGVNAINSLVGSRESIKLYEITVDLYWNGQHKATMKSSTDVRN